TGQLTFSYDPSLGAEESLFPNSPSPDVLENGQAIWYLDDLPGSGESEYFQIQILGPGVEVVGEWFDFTIQLILEDSSGEVYYDNTEVYSAEVVCSYDPNDKYAAFEGYTDSHFVLAEDAIEYRIRFQNSGNYFAEDIVIRDTLDLDVLDIDTFDPLYGSHNFMTCLQQENGVVDFVFSDINLPAEQDDLLGSQGYVVFTIKPRADVVAGDLIENTAYIFFDGNPAIVTNTTWHTIYECGEEANFDVSNDVLCEGEELVVSATHPYVDSYSWSFDGEDMGMESSWNTIIPFEGTYDIILHASNML
ncbi:MAG: hypothetical protein HKN32_02395, partial [Flavobacteriales bacterium]|nr:hypothetical protein [Flavobacteriales bacterium]